MDENVNSFNLTDDLAEYWKNYDYTGAALFVSGLLAVYALAIVVLIVVMILRSRSEFEAVDQLRDLEDMRKNKGHHRTLRVNILRTTARGLAGLCGLAVKAEDAV